MQTPPTWRKGVNIRNDNGSQFIAHEVRQFLRAADANQEFTHIATPEENAYIEAFHSILETEVVQRFELDSYYGAKLSIDSYIDIYNNRRLHGVIDFMTPQQKWDEYELRKKTNFIKSGEADTGNAGEQPARNNLIGEDAMEGGSVYSPFLPEHLISLLKMPKKTQNGYQIWT